MMKFCGISNLVISSAGVEIKFCTGELLSVITFISGHYQFKQQIITFKN